MGTPNELATLSTKYMNLIKMIGVGDVDQAVLRCPLPRNTILELIALSNSQIEHICKSPFLHYKILLPWKEIELFFQKETVVLSRLKAINYLVKPSFDIFQKKNLINKKKRSPK